MDLLNTSVVDVYLSYYGAYIDGEGHIGIKKLPPRSKGFSPDYTERVSVASVNELIIRSFNDIVVGHIYYHESKNKKHQGYWSWEVTNKRAREFLKIIIPYLKIKQLQAKIVLALGKNKESTNSRKLTPKDLELREGLYIILKRLHGNI